MARIVRIDDAPQSLGDGSHDGVDDPDVVYPPRRVRSRRSSRSEQLTGAPAVLRSDRLGSQLSEDDVYRADICSALASFDHDDRRDHEHLADASQHRNVTPRR